MVGRGNKLRQDRAALWFNENRLFFLRTFKCFHICTHWFSRWLRRGCLANWTVFWKLTQTHCTNWWCCGRAPLARDRSCFWRMAKTKVEQLTFNTGSAHEVSCGVRRPFARLTYTEHHLNEPRREQAELSTTINKQPPGGGYPSCSEPNSRAVR